MTTSPLILVAAIALGATFAAPALAADSDAAFDAEVQQSRNLALRGVWQNPYLPQATGAATGESADHRLQIIVASLTRAHLDRGGWRNALMAGDHYAAGEPLLAANIGGGVTSPGAAPDELSQRYASR